MRDEELTAAGVFPVERHPYCAAKVGQLVQLVANGVARPAFPIAARVSSLDDEVGNEPVNRVVVEKSLSRERDEVRHRQWGINHRELELDRAFVGVDEGARRERRIHERLPLRIGDTTACGGRTRGLVLTG